MKRFLQLLLACTVVQALQDLKPGAQWNLRGDTLAGLEWLDKTQTPPTQAQVDADIAACQTGPQPLPLDQRVLDLEAAVNQLSQAANVPVSLPTTNSVGTKKITGL